MLKQCLKGLSGLLCASLVVVSCTSEKVQTNFSLTGEIENPATDYVILKFTDHSDTLQLDSGRFSAEIPMKELTYFTLSFQDGYFPLVGAPAQELSVNFNYQLLDAVPEMTGTMVAENEYLNKKDLFEAQTNEHLRELIGSSTVDFIESVKEIESEKNNLVAELKQAAGSVFSAAFVDREQDKNQVDKQFLMLQFQLYYPYYHEGSFSGDTAFDMLLGDVNYAQPELLDYRKYPDLIKYKLEADMNLGKDENPEFEKMKSAIEEKVKSTPIREHLLTDIYMDEIEYNSVDNVYDEAVAFAASLSDSTIQADMQASLAKWEKLLKGKPAPVIVGEDKDGNPVSTADLAGKVVYVDFWATWCGPCRREIPFMEEMIKANTREDLVYLSVSVDQDKGAWDKWMAEKETHGLQWYGSNDVLREAYNINGIPRYIIINKDGNIYTANAARPSGKAGEVLADLLGEEV